MADLAGQLFGSIILLGLLFLFFIVPIILTFMNLYFILAEPGKFKNAAEVLTWILGPLFSAILYDYMGIGDSSILSVGQDLKATTLEMVDAMVDEDSAIVSIYYGTDATEEAAEEIGAVIEEKYPDVEVEINAGGQPIYYYVISVE